MEQQINTLHQIIQNNPTAPNVATQLKQLKLEVFKAIAANQDVNSNLARAFSELEVFYALKNKAIPEFELAIERLVGLYNQGVQSQEQYQYLGVYLLYLLSFNKFPQFYSQIELLPKQALQHKSISFVLELEQQLSIGNYGELQKYQSQDPNALENVFLERIMDTIRLQIALNAAVSYQKLTLNDGIKMFGLSNVNELQSYAIKNGFDWRFDNANIYFDNKQVNKNPLNSEFLINNQLKYVHELDKII